jgi:hypothetical protein
MSVELDVKLGDRVIPKGDFLECLSRTTRDLFSCAEIPSWELEQIQVEGIGCEPTVFNLAIGDFAEIQCMCYSAGSEDDLGYEGGWWLGVSVLSRNPNSFLLMLITAICIANLAETEIVDDANLLSANRTIEPSAILSVIGGERNRSIVDVAKSVSKAYGRKFGE